MQFTTKLNLYKPGGGLSGTNLPDEVADIDRLNGNFDLIDAAVGASVVTSTTRPATPFVGQIIRETNTGLSYVWSGSQWILLIYGSDTGLAPAGTTADRNNFWGSPSNASERVALANKGARWYNTDNGWFEAYYAANADAGSGEVRTLNGGWSPLAGRVPLIHVSRNGGFTFEVANPIIQWDTEQFSQNRIPYDAGTGRFQPNIGGLYRITAKVGMTNNATNFQLRFNKNGTLAGISQGFGSGLGNVDLSFTELVYCNGSTDFLTFSGSTASSTGITPGPTSAFCHMEYVKPF